MCGGNAIAIDEKILPVCTCVCWWCNVIDGRLLPESALVCAGGSMSLMEDCHQCRRFNCGGGVL